MAEQKLFRSVALERLSSPDQLDQLVKVTNPKGWIALITLITLIVAAIFWGVFGSIPTKVSALGILIRTTGVADILATGSGMITTIYVEKNEYVEKGQVIARIDQADLVDSLITAQDYLDTLLKRQGNVSQLRTRSQNLQDASARQRRDNIAKQIVVSKEKINILNEKIKNQEVLFKEGLITKQTLLATEEEIKNIQGEIRQYRNQLQNIDVEEISLEREETTQDFSLKQQIAEAVNNIESLEDKLENTSKVISPFSGRVVEITASVGDMVSPGQAILNLERMGNDIQDLEAIVYVSPMDGKKVKTGMKIQISPSTVKQEEFGFMEGVVTFVSSFPSTNQGMMKILKNEKLVTMFSQNAAPVAIQANLIPATDTFSGYSWSSKGGPPLKITTGTVCTALITVRQQPPITLVIPTLKKWFGLV